MTPIAQSLSKNLSSWKEIKENTTSFVSKHLFFIGTNVLAQRFMVILRSFNPSAPPLDPTRFLDLCGISLLKQFAENFLMPSSFKDRFELSLASSAFSISTYSAYKFSTDPTFDFSSLLLLFGSVSLSWIFEQRNRFIHVYKIITDAPNSIYFSPLCSFLDGDLVAINEAMRIGINIDKASYLKRAIVSDNVECVSFMLEKTKKCCPKFWNKIFAEISFQCDNFPSNSDEIFDLCTFGGSTILLHVFEKDNLEIFKVLWKHADQNVKNRGSEVLKLALRLGAGNISKFLLKQGFNVPELEKIKSLFNLTLENFLPIIFLKLNEYSKLMDTLFLSQINSLKDKEDRIKINLQNVLNKLLESKSFITEMATYLALKESEENLQKEDSFGLYPIDYSVLSYKCPNSFSDFLMRSKVDITLGTTTPLHLACFLYKEGIVKILLQKCDEYFSKRTIQKHPFNMLPEQHKKIHRILPWGKIEFVNRASSIGLTSLHYALLNFPDVSPKIIALLLKAGAKDDKAPFIKFSLSVRFSGDLRSLSTRQYNFLKKMEVNQGEYLIPAFSKSRFLQKINQPPFPGIKVELNYTEQFMQLTALEYFEFLIENIKINDKQDRVLGLLMGNINLDEILIKEEK